MLAFIILVDHCSKWPCVVVAVLSLGVVAVWPRNGCRGVAPDASHTPGWQGGAEMRQFACPVRVVIGFVSTCPASEICCFMLPHNTAIREGGYEHVYECQQLLTTVSFVCLVTFLLYLMKLKKYDLSGSKTRFLKEDVISFTFNGNPFLSGIHSVRLGSK